MIRGEGVGGQGGHPKGWRAVEDGLCKISNDLLSEAPFLNANANANAVQAAPSSAVRSC